MIIAAIKLIDVKQFYFAGFHNKAISASSALYKFWRLKLLSLKYVIKFQEKKTNYFDVEYFIISLTRGEFF